MKYDTNKGERKEKSNYPLRYWMIRGYMNNIFVIVGSGDMSFEAFPYDVTKRKYKIPLLEEIEECKDVCIAATDGIVPLILDKGIIPDIAIGDWDSLLKIEDHNNIPQKIVGDALKEHKIYEQVKEVITLPVEKDETDSLAAIKLGLARGYKIFHLYGMLGGTRVDHSIANIQSLLYLHNQGAKGYIFNGNQMITILENETKTFANRQGGDVSLFAIDREVEVSISGMKYNLEHAILTNDNPLGVSNSFVGGKASIEVIKGVALLVVNCEI